MLENATFYIIYNRDTKYLDKYLCNNKNEPYNLRPGDHLYDASPSLVHGSLAVVGFTSSLTPSFVGMEEARLYGEFTEPHFLHLPTEIHEHIIRYCGVSDVASLALVNRFLNNVIRSKLRDFLIAGCQNGNSSRMLVELNYRLF